MDGFFGIENGKTFNIRLKGITISSVQGKLTVKSTAIELPALPLGLRQPVALPIGLMNIGSGPLRYTIDVEQLEASQPELLRSGAIRFQNGANNIPAWKKVNFVIFFRPVCHQTVSFPLDIKVFDYYRQIQSIRMEVTASPTATLDTGALEAFFKVDDDLVTSEGLVKELDQGCYVSDDMLDFRGCRPHSVNERVISLANPSEKESIEFWFDGFDLTHSKHITAVPNRGVIPARGVCMVTFVYFQNEGPLFWEGEIAMSVRMFGEGQQGRGKARGHSAILAGEDDPLSPHCHQGTKESLDAQRLRTRKLFLRVKVSTDLTVS